MSNQLKSLSLIVFLSSAVCALLPLVTKVARNFEYEYTILVNLCLLVVFPLNALWLDRFRINKSSDKEMVVCFFLTVILSSFTLMLPATISFVLDWCPCSSSGLYFWSVLNIFPTVVLASSLLFFIVFLRQRDWSFRSILTLYLLFHLLNLLRMGYFLWFFPQKRLVDFSLGFFHGPIYDRWIPIDEGIVWARIFHLVLVITVYLCVWFVRKKSRLVSTFFFLSLTILLYTKVQSYPSYQNSMIGLKYNLSKNYIGKGFVVHAKNNLSLQQQKQMKALISQTEFHLEELKKRLLEDIYPEVHIFVYNNHNEKKLWFGGFYTDITEVHTPSVHLVLKDGFYPTLRHELVHALTADIAFHGLGFHPNMAFTEGLAEALAPSERLLSLDVRSAMIFSQKRLVDMQEIFSPFFWLRSNTVSYSLSGSFVKYLIDQYGIVSVKEVYRGINPQEVFKKQGFENIVEAWKAFIEEKLDQQKFAMLGEKLLRKKSVVSDQCPHSIEDLKKSKDSSYLIAWRRPLNWDAKRDYHDWLLSIKPQEKKSYIRTLKRKVRSSFRKKESLKPYLEEIDKLKNREIKYIEDVELLILASDILKHENILQHRIFLQQLVDLTEKVDLGSFKRQIYIRKLVEEKLETDLNLKWRTYLAGWTEIPEPSLNEDPYLHYLRLRYRYNRQDFDVKTLQEFNRTKVDKLDLEIQTQWYKILAISFYNLNLYEESEQNWIKAASVSKEGRRSVFLQFARYQRHLAQKG